MRLGFLFLILLKVWTKESGPREWGLCHLNIGAAYSLRQQGDHNENMKAALYHSTIALETITKADYPNDWATGMYNIGKIHARTTTGL
jgi:hypothetical protein